MARSNARLEVSGAGKTEDGLVQYNEEVNKLGDDLRELYETIRVNVDEEVQWKVFDFVEDFFMEELEIGDYINDINSYHLHMFDKHDVTTKKLDVIVEKAGKVDAVVLGKYGMVVRRHIQALPKIWMRNISNLIIGMSLQLVILMMRFGKLMKSF